MLLVLNEWLFHDLLGENGADAFRETVEFLMSFDRSADRLVVPSEPRWMEKAFQLMSMSDPRQRLVSKLLHRLLRDPDRAVRIEEEQSQMILKSLSTRVPEEDVYLIFAYFTAAADVLVTTDDGLFDALANEDKVTCRMRGDFLAWYPWAETDS